MVATTMGKNAARKIRKIAAALVTPKSTIAIGIQARAEIGRRNWTTGFAAMASAAEEPMSSPSGRPRSSASP